MTDEARLKYLNSQEEDAWWEEKRTEGRLLVLGPNHMAIYTTWSPDRDLNPQYEGLPDVEKWGLIYRHRRPDGRWCEGAITFDGEVQRKVEPNRTNRWAVTSWDPLTLSPSLLCKADGCGDHGFIREGKWIPA